MIKLVRLDYRLLHGQVVFAWTGHINAQRIIVVDDAAANDELKKSALSLAKMPKVEALEENIMMIFGNVATLKAFCDAYPKIREINYGGLSNRPGSRQFGQAVFMTEEEAAATKSLMERGIRIYMQQTPSHKEEALKL